MSNQAESKKTMVELKKRLDELGEIPGGRTHYSELSDMVDQVEQEITQRMRVEEALRESERRLFTLMSNLPGMAYRCLNDEDWTMEFVSEGCEGLTGYPSEDLIRNRRLAYNDLIHPDDREMVLQMVNQGVEQHKPYQMVYRIEAKDGLEKWVWEQGEGVLSSQGEHFVLEGFIADITPLKKAEQEREKLLFAMKERLKEQRCMYRVVNSFRIQDSLDAIFHEVVQSIPGGWHYTEITRAKIRVGGHEYVSSSFKPTPWRQECEIFANGVKQGLLEVYYLEDRPVKAEGPFTREERKLIDFIAEMLGRFIERKRAEEAVRESEERFRSLVETTSDWIWEVDAQGVFTYVSPKVKTLLGYEPQEVLGKTPFDLMMPDEAKRLAKIFQKNLESRVAIDNLENVNRHKDGRLVVLETHAVPILGEDGILHGYRGVDRDITERKRTESERLTLESKVQHTQKLESLGVLAGGLAHDFNNLLMAIMGNADLSLGKLPSDSPVKENLVEIVETTERAADLCKQMLAYSGKGKFVIESIDLARVVAEMAQMLEVSISKKALLVYDFAENLPCIEADATQLRQVIMNLITNASEAIGDNEGVISIRSGVMDCEPEYLRESYLGENLPASRYVYLEVSDTGCGMDPETQARLFDPFFTTKVMGRGLGLSAVLGIVRSHKGTIKIDSEIGRGTLFRVLFPAMNDDDSGAGAAEGSRKTQPEALTGTILLVDDEPSVREVVKRMLEKIGLTVWTASDGQEAIEVFRERMSEISCVLLDLTMPRMNGEEAFHELRRLNPNILVIMSSGYSEQEISRQFLDEGLMDFIQKPYQMATLHQKMRNIMENEKTE